MFVTFCRLAAFLLATITAATCNAQSLDFDGLRFQSPTFVSQSSDISYSVGEVKVGFTPVKGLTFSPLLLFPNGIRIDKKTGETTITTKGKVYALGKKAAQHLLYDGAITVPLTKLTKRVKLKKRKLKVGKFSFTLASFYLANEKPNNQGAAEVRLEGSIEFPKVVGLTLKVDKTNYVAIGANGIKLSGGAMSVSRSFYLGPLHVKAEKLSASYNNKKDTFTLSGGISLPSLWKATAQLPDKGLEIVKGDIQLHGITLSLSDVHLGVANLEKIKLIFKHKKGKEEIDIEASAKMEIVSLLEVDADIKLLNGVPDKIEIEYTAEGPAAMIPLGDSGLFINSLGGGIDHLYKETEDLTIELEAGLQAGDLSATPLSLIGDLTINLNGLKFAGDAEFERLSGNISAGKGKGLIDFEWGQGFYLLELHLTLVDIFDIDDKLTINSSGDISMLGDVALQMPDFIPYLGGKHIASANFYLQIRPEDTKQDFAAAWLDINLLLAHPTVGVKAAWNQDPVLSFVGSTKAKDIVSKYYPPKSTPEHRYTFDVNLAAGAASAMLYVDWPETAPDMKISVTPHAGQSIAKKDFDPKINGLYLVTKPAKLKPTAKSVVIGIVNPASFKDSHALLKPGSYKLELSTHTKLDLHKDINFSAHYQYPPPVLTINDIKIDAGQASIDYHFISTFPNQTQIHWFIDWTDPDNSKDGLLLPQQTKGVTHVPVGSKAGDLISGKYTFDVSQFLPLDYIIYGIIKDSESAPIRSTSEKSFSPAPVLSGLITDDKHQDLSGWTVTLDGNNSAKATGENGFWGYSYVKPGSHNLSLNLPHDWKMEPGSDRNRQLSMNKSGAAKVESFVVQKLSTISGRIFEDLNLDGKFDPGDVLLPNYTVYLSKTDGKNQTTTSTVVTNTKGEYSVLLPKGLSLSLSIKPGSDWKQTYPFTSSYELKTPSSGLKLSGNDFGLIQTGSVSGLVYNDINNSGQWEAIDSPHISGTVSLKLLNSGRAKPVQLKADKNGHFSVSHIYPGNYQLALDQQAHWEQTEPKFNNFKGFGDNNVAVQGLPQLATNLISADFNADGIADIAYSSDKSGAVKVISGLGNSVFSKPKTYSVFSSLPAKLNAPKLVIGDIDNDGDKDIVIWAGRFAALRNDGKGSFKLDTKVSKSSAEHINNSTLLLTDLNQDSFSDIVYADNTHLKWMSNNGKGLFSAPQNLIASPAIEWLVSKDFDLDGKNDLAFTSSQGATDVYVYTNQGKGSFKQSAQLINGLVQQRNGMISADLDGNGHSDLVVSGSNMAATFLYDPVSKTFTNGHDVPNAFSQLFAADLTGHGYSVLFDLTNGHYFNNSKDGSAVFRQKDLLGEFADKSTTFIDTNDDHVLDLVAAGSDLFVWPSIINTRLDYQIKIRAGSHTSTIFGVQKTKP